MITIIEYYEDAGGEWRWRMKATNGRIIADSGEGYASRTGVRRAVRSLVSRLSGRVNTFERGTVDGIQDAAFYDAGLSRVML